MPRATGSFGCMQEISLSLLIFFVTCFVAFFLDEKRRFFITSEAGGLDT